MKSIPGFLDFSETYTAAGLVRAVLLGLPRGHSCRIAELPDGQGFERVTMNYSKHGKRYERFSRYDAALAASIKWGRRKLAEAKREAKA